MASERKSSGRGTDGGTEVEIEQTRRQEIDSRGKSYWHAAGDVEEEKR